MNSIFNSLDGPSAHSEDVENDDVNDNDNDDDETDGELEGAVGGESLPSVQTDSENTEERRTSLLDELQREIDRLRLLSPTGQFNYINFIFTQDSRFLILHYLYY